MAAVTSLRALAAKARGKPVEPEETMPPLTEEQSIELMRLDQDMRETCWPELQTVRREIERTRAAQR